MKIELRPEVKTALGIEEVLAARNGKPEVKLIVEEKIRWDWPERPPQPPFNWRSIREWRW